MLVSCLLQGQHKGHVHRCSIRKNKQEGSFTKVNSSRSWWCIVVLGKLTRKIPDSLDRNDYNECISSGGGRGDSLDTVDTIEHCSIFLLKKKPSIADSTRENKKITHFLQFLFSL